MAQGYSAEMVGVIDGSLVPEIKADGRVINAKLRTFQATFDLSLAAVKKASGDTNVLFRLPRGYKPIMGVLLASATMGGTATIAIGNASTPAKYRAAATFTTANVPTPFMLSSAGDDAPLTDEETVIMTIAAADLPGSGILQIWMLCSGR